VRERILIIHLEALGAVLRSTSLIAAIRRRYPGAAITWVTKTPALLQNLGLERVLSTSADDLLALEALHFDLAFVIDKSLVANGVLARTVAKEVRGFRPNSVGAIVPANREAMELWELGLDDERKFFVNQKTEQELVHQALALGTYTRDEYVITLNAGEEELARLRRSTWAPKGEVIVGLNTGCAATLPAKKLSIEGHRQLIEKIQKHPRLRNARIVLLGGTEDSERNALIGHNLDIIQSPTGRGLRDGLASVAACDLIFSGDSLGMHMAIGLRKWVVAWFGPSCAQEIDLYDRGVKLRTQAPCSPCWKRVCQQSVMCYDQVDLQAAVTALAQGLDWLTSSSKPHFQETSSLASL
jgi:heptosyltransferase-2